MTDTASADQWSDGGQIYFIGEKAFGITPKLKTIYIGKKQEILDALDNNKGTGNEIVDGILRLEKENLANAENATQPIARRTRIKLQRRSPKSNVYGRGK